MPKPQSPMHRQQLPGASTITHEQLSAIQEMRALLLEVGNKIGASNWTREHAAEILDVIAEGLSPLIDMEVPNEDGDFRLFEQHATTEILASLADALRDINYGNLDSRFRKPKGLGGAAHKASERKAVKAYLGYVDWVKHCDGSNYPDAEKKVAAYLAERGIKFRDKAISIEMLDGWRRTYLKSRASSK